MPSVQRIAAKLAEIMGESRQVRRVILRDRISRREGADLMRALWVDGFPRWAQERVEGYQRALLDLIEEEETEGGVWKIDTRKRWN